MHQSADLYGSDRVLLALIKGLDTTRFCPIILLPVDGPLVHEFRSAGIECHVVPVTRLSRSVLSIKGLMRLPIDLIQSARAFNRVLNGRTVSLVYSNTLAVLSAALWARWYRIPHVWHVHEIVVNPNFVRKIYAQLLSHFADCIICVSHATKNNLLEDKPELAEKIRVVWNGFERTAPADNDAVALYRSQLGVAEGQILVALVGRINRWKGQRLLVAAANILWQKNVRNIRYLIVGSAPDGQQHFLDELQNDIYQSPAREFFTVQGFTNNLWTIWDACDLAVIPSTEPEPFGMVALEAMTAGKSIIAANHGGLSEIVVQGETGVLVPPSSAVALAQAIESMSMDDVMRRDAGIKGAQRAATLFSIDAYNAGISAILDANSR